MPSPGARGLGLDLGDIASSMGTQGSGLRLTAPKREKPSVLFIETCRGRLTKILFFGVVRKVHENVLFLKNCSVGSKSFYSETACYSFGLSNTTNIVRATIMMFTAS